jgi:threonine dehydratase
VCAGYAPVKTRPHPGIERFDDGAVAGMRVLLQDAGLVVEPSAALGIAAILEDRDRFAGRHVVTIVCGSNVDMDAYRRWAVSGPGNGEWFNQSIRTD